MNELNGVPVKKMKTSHPASISAYWDDIKQFIVSNKLSVQQLVQSKGSNEG